jgi:hypothetical protein
MELQITSLKQVPPITDTDATVEIGFSVQETDVVEFYASTAPQGVLDRGNIQAVVETSPPKSDYVEQLHLRPGAMYTVAACPRSGTKDAPEDYVDGEYWEGYCAYSFITTRSTGSPPSGGVPAPVVTSLEPRPTTMKQGSSVIVDWTGALQYDRFTIRWTDNGIVLQQQDVSTGGSTGSWRAPTTPGHHYTFAVDGHAGTWSGWGPAIDFYAPANLSSLRAFLEASGVPPSGQSVRQLMAGQASVKAFMHR